MNSKPIKTEQDYQQALKRLEEIFTAKPDTNEGDELEILGILIEHYEEEHYPVDSPDPIEARISAGHNEYCRREECGAIFGESK
ncbi:MAG: hypothetical protein WCI01_00875 [Chlorobiaceae bacterium]